jgi:outer membrane protein TolC
MMRWKTVVVGLTLTLALAAGCKQRIFLQECDYEEYQKLGLPAKAECTPNIEPNYPEVQTPATVDFPERPARYLTLAEAFAIALERGTTGIQSVRLFGTANDDLVNFTGNPALVTGSDNIRVLALEPAIVGTEIEFSLSKFDATWISALNWNSTDEPFQSGTSVGNINPRNGMVANFFTGIKKPLPEGGDVAAFFGGGASPQFGNPFLSSNPFYQNLTNPITAGPFSNLKQSYNPNLTFQYNQPLLRAFGVEINELLPRHPSEGTALDPARTTFNLNDSGILISRVRFDQSRAEFERNVTFMLTNIETAYWNLYGAYVTLYASEQGMRLAHKVWEITKQQLEVGKTDITKYSPTLGQYEQFRADRIGALGQVLERERTLRALIGLPVEDGTRLVPIDPPTLTPYQPSWQEALREALTLRPELVIAREDLKVRQFEILREKNNLLPDLRLNSQYEIHGLGSRLDGEDTFPNGMTDNAFRSLASNHFDSWAVGLSLNVPIGYRAAYASIRAARLRLAEGYWQLRDQEDRATRFLAQQYRQMFQSYDEIQGRSSQRQAYGEQLRAEIELISSGKKTADLTTLDAMRQWTTALNAEYQAVVAYNNAMAAFEFAKGTSLQHDGVVVSEGPLPNCAQVQATEHERQRTLAILKRQRAAAGNGCGANGCGLPDTPHGSAPSIAALLPDKLSPKGPELENRDRMPEQLLPQPTPREQTLYTPGTKLPVTAPETTPGRLDNLPIVSEGLTLPGPGPSSTTTPPPSRTGKDSVILSPESTNSVNKP